MIGFAIKATNMPSLKHIFKFILRFCFHLSLFLFILCPLQLLGGIILLPTSYLVKNNPLPTWLKWFDNADQYVGRDTSVYFAVRSSGWWNNYLWLAWRNPLNYFGYQVLGFIIQQGFIQTVYSGSANVGDGTGQLSGFYFSEVEQNGSTYYEYYFIIKYSTTTCFRFRMGHKIGSALPGVLCQFVGVISPYHSYNGQ